MPYAFHAVFPFSRVSVTMSKIPWHHNMLNAYSLATFEKRWQQTYIQTSQIGGKMTSTVIWAPPQA